MSFETDVKIITKALYDFYKKSISGAGLVIHQPPMDTLISSLELASLVRDGGLSGEKLARF